MAPHQLDMMRAHTRSYPCGLWGTLESWPALRTLTVEALRELNPQHSSMHFQIKCHAKGE